MKALKRFIAGRWLYLVDQLNDEYVNRSLRQSEMFCPEHRAEIVDVQIVEVSNAVDSQGGDGAAVLGFHHGDERDGAEVSVMTRERINELRALAIDAERLRYPVSFSGAELHELLDAASRGLPGHDVLTRHSLAQIEEMARGTDSQPEHEAP